MRPHIEQREAQYLYELLQASQNIHNQLKTYYEALEKEVNRLDDIKKTDRYEAFKRGYGEKKAELEQWSNLRWGLGYAVYVHQPIHQTLLLKYQNIAEGKKHRGTYKHLNHILDIRLCTRDKGSLQRVLEKELQPIENIGVEHSD